MEGEEWERVLREREGRFSGLRVWVEIREIVWGWERG